MEKSTLDNDGTKTTETISVPEEVSGAIATIAEEIASRERDGEHLNIRYVTDLIVVATLDACGNNRLLTKTLLEIKHPKTLLNSLRRLGLHERIGRNNK